MCRIAAFPPGTTQEEARKIATHLVGTNLDGVGSGYLKDGEFHINKMPVSMPEADKAGLPIFSHMPHDGWTIFHTRFGTHGDKTMENTHPFSIGDYCFAHNGVWSESEVCRFALLGFVEFKGETDSEVAGYFFNKYGPDDFYKIVKRGGVFLGLHRSGELHIVKTFGDLNIATVDPAAKIAPGVKCYIASDLTDVDDKTIGSVMDSDGGVIKLAADGTLMEAPKLSEVYRYKSYQGQGLFLGGCSTDSCQTQRSSYKSYKDDSKSEKKSGSNVNVWLLDPDNYLVNMVGAMD